MLLIELWHAVFGDKRFPEGVSSERWADMGWQGKSPLSDLRGAGILGLRLLLSMAKVCGLSC